MAGSRLMAAALGALALTAAGAVLLYSGTLLKAFLAAEDKDYGLAATFFVSDAGPGPGAGVDLRGVGGPSDSGA